MENLSIKFRTNLVSLRETHSLNQEALAEKCGVSRLTISRWERGETWPQPEQIESLAAAFKVSVSELFGSSQQSPALSGGIQQAPASSGGVQQLLKSLAKNADLIEMIANIDNAETIQLIKDFIKGNAEFEKSEVPKIPLYESPASCGSPDSATDEVLRYLKVSDLGKGEFFGCIANGESMSPLIQDEDIMIFKSSTTAKSGEVVIARVNGENTVKRLVGEELIPENPKFKKIKEPFKVLGVLVKIERGV